MTGPAGNCVSCFPRGQLLSAYFTMHGKMYELYDYCSQTINCMHVLQGQNWIFSLAQAFCDPNFPLDPQHPQMEIWGTDDVPSIHNAVPAASDLMPK